MMHPLRETLSQFFKILNIELPYEPVIPLLDIYAQEIIHIYPYKIQDVDIHSGVIHMAQK